MKNRTDPMCPKCGEEEETTHNAMMMVRYSIFGCYLMEANELQQVQLHTLLRFAQASEIYITFSGLRTGPKLTTASALDGLSCLPPKIK